MKMLVSVFAFAVMLLMQAAHEHLRLEHHALNSILSWNAAVSL